VHAAAAAAALGRRSLARRRDGRLFLHSLSELRLCACPTTTSPSVRPSGVVRPAGVVRLAVPSAPSVRFRRRKWLISGSRGKIVTTKRSSSYGKWVLPVFARNLLQRVRVHLFFSRRSVGFYVFRFCSNAFRETSHNRSYFSRVVIVAGDE